jgi:hypothetical protein
MYLMIFLGSGGYSDGVGKTHKKLIPIIYQLVADALYLAHPKAQAFRDSFPASDRIMP